MPFDPTQHLMKIQGKDYLEVKWRIVWFKTEHPEGSIETEVISETERGVTFKATVSYPLLNTNEQNNYYSPYHLVVGVGHAFEPWEKPRRMGGAHENCETSAIGRALAALGYGTQFAPEYEDTERIVDSPVPRNAGAPQPSTTGQRGPAPQPTPIRGSTAPSRSSQAPAELIASYRKRAAEAADAREIKRVWDDATHDKAMLIPEVAYAVTYHATRHATSLDGLRVLWKAAEAGQFEDDAEFAMAWQGRKTYLEQTAQAKVAK